MFVFSKTNLSALSLSILTSTIGPDNVNLISETQAFLGSRKRKHSEITTSKSETEASSMDEVYVPEGPEIEPVDVDIFSRRERNWIQKQLDDDEKTITIIGPESLHNALRRDKLLRDLVKSTKRNVLGEKSESTYLFIQELHHTMFTKQRKESSLVLGLQRVMHDQLTYILVKSHHPAIEKIEMNHFYIVKVILHELSHAVCSWLNWSSLENSHGVRFRTIYLSMFMIYLSGLKSRLNESDGTDNAVNLDAQWGTTSRQVTHECLNLIKVLLTSEQFKDVVNSEPLDPAALILPTDHHPNVDWAPFYLFTLLKEKYDIDLMKIGSDVLPYTSGDIPEIGATRNFNSNLIFTCVLFVAEMNKLSKLDPRDDHNPTNERNLKDSDVKEKLKADLVNIRNIYERTKDDLLKKIEGLKMSKKIKEGKAKEVKAFFTKKIYTIDDLLDESKDTSVENMTIDSITKNQKKLQAMIHTDSIEGFIRRLDIDMDKEALDSLIKPITESNQEINDSIDKATDISASRGNALDTDMMLKDLHPFVTTEPSFRYIAKIFEDPATKNRRIDATTINEKENQTKSMVTYRSTLGYPIFGEIRHKLLQILGVTNLKRDTESIDNTNSFEILQSESNDSEPELPSDEHSHQISEFKHQIEEYDKNRNATKRLLVTISISRSEVIIYNMDDNWSRTVLKSDNYVKNGDASIKYAFLRPNYDHVLVGWSNGVVKLLDISSGREIMTIQIDPNRKNDDYLTDASFSSDGEMVATISRSNPAQLWSIRDGKCIKTLYECCESIDMDHLVLLGPDNDHIFKLEDSSYGKSGRLMNIKTRSIISFRGHKSSIQRAHFSKDGSKLITGDSDGIIILWDTRSGAVVRKFETDNKNKGGIKDIMFAPGESKILSSYLDGTIVIWGVKYERIQEIFHLTNPSGYAESVAFFNGGSGILSLDNSGLLEVWDVKSDLTKVSSEFWESTIPKYKFKLSARVLSASFSSHSFKGSIGVAKQSEEPGVTES